MSFSNIVVVPKLTMVQVDLNRYALDEAGLRARYLNDGKNPDKIFSSHERQLESIELLKNRFPGTICYREGFNKEVAKNADLVIAAGGDDHIKYVSHYLNNTPVLGLNTDPSRSRGALLEDDIEYALKKLEKGDYDIDNETMIEALVNGDTHMLGMCIYQIGRIEDGLNFRYNIEFKNENHEHTITSGVIVYNGNGMDDWTKGASRYLGRIAEFDPKERKIGWVVREPNDYYRLISGTVNDGETLYIKCQKDESKIVPDATREHKKMINSGDSVALNVASTPLAHVRIKD